MVLHEADARPDPLRSQRTYYAHSVLRDRKIVDRDVAYCFHEVGVVLTSVVVAFGIPDVNLGFFRHSISVRHPEAVEPTPFAHLAEILEGSETLGVYEDIGRVQAARVSELEKWLDVLLDFAFGLLVVLAAVTYNRNNEWVATLQAIVRQKVKRRALHLLIKMEERAEG